MPCGMLVYAANAHSWMVFALSGTPLMKNLPGSQSRSASLHSSRCAAIVLAFARILRAASAGRRREVGVERLARAQAVGRGVGVALLDLDVGAGMPSSSATICA